MTNLDLVTGGPLDLVIAVSPMSQAAVIGSPSPGTIIRQSLRARLRADMAAVQASGVTVVAIQPGRAVTAAMGFNPMDAARRGAVSRAARAEVGHWLHEGLDGRHLARLLRDEAEAPGGVGRGVGAGTA
jgi:hypothetical protein